MHVLAAVLRLLLPAQAAPERKNRWTQCGLLTGRHEPQQESSALVDFEQRRQDEHREREREKGRERESLVAVSLSDWTPCAY